MLTSFLARVRDGLSACLRWIQNLFSRDTANHLLGWFKVRKHQYLAGGIAAGVIVVSVTAGIALQTTVPDLSGLTYEQSQERVQQAGLGIDEAVSWKSGLDHQFQVVGTQTPETGNSAWRGNSVRLTMRAADVKVPNVVGKTLAQAKGELKATGLEALSFFDSDAAQAFTVATQSTSAGALLRAGSKVSLGLNLPDIVIPDVSGLTRDKAQAALVKVGFSAEAYSAEVTAEWTAVSTSPAIGSSAQYGSKVAVNYIGPLVTVPDLSGKSPSEAESALKSAGFTIAKDPANASYDWYATGQSVAAGAQANKGSAITVTFSQPTVEYSVTGNGSRATITWIPPGSYSISQASDASLPWSMSFNTTSSYGNFNAQIMNGTEVTCTIKVNGKVVKTNTSTGRYAVVSCG